MKLLDTNVIIRLLVKDSESLSAKSKSLFKRIRDKEEKAVISDVVVTECCFVLQSAIYALSKDEVTEKMSVILNLPNIVTETDKHILSKAFDIFVDHNLHIVDSLLIAKALIKEYELTTYDKKMGKVISRLYSANSKVRYR